MTALAANHQDQIINAMTTAIVILDADLIIKFINHAAEELFSLSNRIVVGKHISRLIKADSLGLNCNFEFSDNTLPVTERSMELELTDGRRLTVDCASIPIFTEDNTPQILLEVRPQDVKIRIEKEELLIAQNKVAIKLVRNLAHEIKNPLGGIRGAAQLLEEELVDESQKEFTQVVIAEVDRLQGLVNRLLGTNQLPNKTEVNIHEVLEHVCKLVEAEVGRENFIQRDYDPSIPSLKGDKDQLIQAILNIMRNAINATGIDGKVKVRTRVRRQFSLGTRRHALVAQIDISDSGPGVPEDIKEQIFLPMISGSSSGSGLGLSIAQSLIGRHRGLIEFSSEPGDTTFTIYIPLENENE